MNDSTIIYKLKARISAYVEKPLHRFNRYFFKRKAIGENSYVDKSVQALGWKNIKIGRSSIISENTWMNVNHRGDTTSLIIGNNCFIGRRNFFTTGKLINIKDYCLTGVDCRFLGSGHLYESPFIPYIAAGTAEDGVIEIGVNCWLGANVTVLKNIVIGYGSIIGASTVVNQTIPPLSIVVGNPCRITKRYDMQRRIWVRVQDYPEDGDNHLMNETDYLEVLSKTPINMWSLRIASSKAFGDL